jgi:hypothetical protein
MPAETPVQYARLPGKGRPSKGVAFIAIARTTCTLWLGNDHLLQVETAGYGEHYRRFYFRDIQAITLYKTKSWQTALAFLGAVTALFLLWALVAGSGPLRIVLLVIASVCGLFLAQRLWSGPSCRCYLQSAVHLEELPSLQRQKNALKVLARLKPLIEAAQGVISAETIALQYAALLEEARVQAAVPGQLSRVSNALPVTAYRGPWHRILFAALLANAFSNILNIFWPGLPVVLLTMIINAAIAISAVVALVKQHQTTLPAALRVLTWCSGLFMALNYGASYVMHIVLAPSEHLDGTEWAYLKALAALQPFATHWWLGILAAAAVLSLVLGGCGLFLLRRPMQLTETAA